MPPIVGGGRRNRTPSAGTAAERPRAGAPLHQWQHPIRVGHTATPSPFHPLGLKGAGESGLGGALAAATNAVADALGDLAPGLTTVPATPPRLMAVLAAAAAAP